jgi:hypothetical protein
MRKGWKNMTDLTANDILDKPAEPIQHHAGVVRIQYDLLKQLDIDIKNCNVQGEFQEKGVFAALQKKLLLPESYTIYGLFLGWPFREWQLVVESPDLPVLEEGCEPPNITPIYRSVYPKYPPYGDKTYELVKIMIEDRWQRTYSPQEVTLEVL